MDRLYDLILEHPIWSVAIGAFLVGGLSLLLRKEELEKVTRE
jgi:hypothetical protein